MTAKQYLSQVKELQANIEMLETSIERIRYFASGAGGIDYSKDKVQTSPTNRTEDLLIKAVESEERLITLKRNYKAQLELITEQIVGMDRWLFKVILYGKYVEGKPLKLIAKEFNFSFDHVRHSHGHALQAFELKYPEIFQKS